MEPIINTQSILAFDYGETSIGVAVAKSGEIGAQPLTTLLNDDQLATTISRLLEAEHPGVLVIGWPRGLNGQSTAQTRAAEEFAQKLHDQTGLPVEMQDEAVTSEAAEALLPPNLDQVTRKNLLHQYAAKIFLEEYLATHHSAQG